MKALLPERSPEARMPLDLPPARADTPLREDLGPFRCPVDSQPDYAARSRL